MIGIDLTDLNDPLLKKRNNDSLRFISHPLDNTIDHINHPFWCLWTAKEAVFKAKRDLTSFAPKRLPVRFELTKDTLDFKSENPICGRTFLFNQLVLSVASFLEVDQIEYQFFPKKSNNASQEVRDVIQEYILNKYDKKVAIINDGNGLPIIGASGTPISFSHHGEFLAFAFHRDSLKQ